MQCQGKKNLVVLLEESSRFYIMRCDIWVILPLVLGRWRVLFPPKTLQWSENPWILGQLMGLTTAWALASAPDLPSRAAPWGTVPGPALLSAALQRGAWSGQNWPFLAPSLKSIAGPDYQQGLVSSGLGLFSSSANEVVGVGAHCCSRRSAGRQTATGHNGREPRPGILLFCPCLRSWRQLDFVAYSELHLSIYEGWIISSSYQEYFSAEIHQATHKWMKTCQTWPHTNQRVV